MTVRKRPDGRWQADIVVYKAGERVRVREACGRDVRSRAGALEYERRRRAELEGGAPTGKDKTITFEEHANEVHRVVTCANLKHATQLRERCLLDVHLIPELGDLRLDEIDDRQIAHLTAYAVEKKLAPGTINNLLSGVRKMLRVAVEWGRLVKAPKIKRRKKAPARPDFFDFEEAPRFLAAVDPSWRPMMLCGVRAGLRRGELLELRWKDIDLVKGVLTVSRNVYRGVIGTPKGGSVRDVPLSEELRAELKRLRQLRDPEDLCFAHPTGRAYTFNELTAPLLRASKRAGLRVIGMHVLRHTFASHLVMRGVSLKVVQELMGHTNIEQTMIYAHLTPEARRDAVLLLDEPAPNAKKNDRTG